MQTIIGIVLITMILKVNCRISVLQNRTCPKVKKKFSTRVEIYCPHNADETQKVENYGKPNVSLLNARR